ncbi:hypothetical protein pdam_00017131 [Pocillopora damicornis]|uniref:Uncharacterized protein n=1 Tax=Pocillopora damicornis TaxID=46731 RepID=A0A3M6U562_POCDA|nr:hypothetical protein pdam_00017131 [Pocillopora damicornis]
MIAPKKQITIGFLNVRTLAGATRTVEVAKRLQDVEFEEVKDVEEFAYLGAIVEKKGGGSEDIRNNAEGTRCIPEAMEGVGRGIGKRAMICLFKTLV